MRILHDFAIRGYVLDRERLKNRAFPREGCFVRPLAEIRQIRLSGRRFQQKITDIYATSADCGKNASAARGFYAKVLDKFYYTI